MDNRRDEHGDPICPLCDKAIPARVNVARSGESMIHLSCLIERGSVIHPRPAHGGRESPPAPADRRDPDGATAG